MPALFDGGGVSTHPDAVELLLAGPDADGHGGPAYGGCSGREETVREHFATSGIAGSGTASTSGTWPGERPIGAVDVGPVRLVALDTVNPHGGWQGSLGPEQLAWLTAQLQAGKTRRYLDDTGALGARRSPGPAVRDLQPPHHRNHDQRLDQQAGPRVLGTQVKDLLLRFPNVVLWVNGHTHRNTRLRR